MKRTVGPALLLAALLGGCASGGFNSAQKVEQLQVGLTFSQVTGLLGQPKEIHQVDGKTVATFWLHQAWRGNVPFDLVFAGDPERLESWSENEEKFAESQEKLATITQIVESAAQSGGGAGGGPAGPNDPELQRQIAGLWWGYEGSTERSIGLCADGSYYDSQESSYSGRSFNSLGDQTMAWGAASQGGAQGRWTINGSAQSGTIYVKTASGQEKRLQYQQIGDPGCLSIDGNTLCRKSAECR